MDLHVTFDGRRDLAGQIYAQIRAAILDGHLHAGASLPPSRDLARQLVVSRNTVNVAYERLAAEGYVAARVGAGTFVTGALRPPPSTVVDGVPSRLTARAVWRDMPLPREEPPPGTLDFRPGLPDVGLFPFQAWRRLVAAQLHASALPPGLYGQPAGHPALRAAIARHIGVSRGIYASTDDVLITNGTQQAVDLIARVLVAPGDKVAVEHPGYPVPRLLFTSLGADVCHVPVDEEGIVVDAIPKGVRVVYVTPSHQFPLGMPMSLSRRTQLLAWASRTSAVIIEDDYDTEFRFTGRPIEPLHALDVDRRVIYVGSFSKVLLPGLRLGFMVAPQALNRPLRAAKFVTDWHTELSGQGALAAFIDDGDFARHVRRARSVYAARHELIAETVARDFAGVLDLIPCIAGLHLSAYGTGGAAEVLADPDWSRRAAEVGVAIDAVRQYDARRPTRAGLIFGYGAVPRPGITEGLRRLRTLF